MTDVSIILPVFNGASFTRRSVAALISLRRQRDVEIIVVDDASTDLTPSYLAPFGDEIRVVRHAERTGYAATCNDGAALATGTYLVFLRNDALPRGGWLDALARCAGDQPKAAVVGSKLLGPDGTIEQAGIAIGQDGVPRPLYPGLPEDHAPAAVPRPLQAVAVDGALVLREAFVEAGGFDPALSAGYEAVDLCLRLADLRFEVWYCPQSVLSHLRAGPSGWTPHGEAPDARAGETFRLRWAGRLRPDEPDHYADDGRLARSIEVPDPATSQTRSQLVADTLAVVQSLIPEADAARVNGHAPDAPGAVRRGDAGDVRTRIDRVAATYRDRFGVDPAVLDWDSGLDLAELAPHLTVFSPATADRLPLPYLDHSVDLVVVGVGDADVLAEARRVAFGAVVSVIQPGRLLPEPLRAALGTSAPPTQLRVEWLDDAGASVAPSVSIVIPVFNKLEYTEVCLAALDATLLDAFDGEIIVVDDASVDGTPAALERWAAGDARRKVVRNAENAGFIDTCNRGAAVATGELLLFLNNDTIPLPGWLSAVVQTFRDYPDAGAVGGKLLYPDGTLQEAGGVIFSDGSGCNYGKYDRDPDAPRYSYVREVDYCSGAMLATPRALFAELGGFDTRYAPAYYEDSDYCFAVRERGYKVLYQCDSRIIHVEGASAGTDLGAGMKRHQVANRHTFLEKWRSRLEGQPAPPDRYDFAVWQALAARPGVKRALVAAPRLPEFDREGGSGRIFHVVEFLRAKGWAVTFLARGDFPAGEKYVRALRQLGVATYPDGMQLLADGEYQTEADRLIGTGAFDLAILAFWWIAEFYAPTIRRLSPATRIALDSIDLQFLRNARGIFHDALSGEGPGELDAQYAELMRREINAFASMDAVLAVSQKEADIVNDFVGDTRLAYSLPINEDAEQSPIPFEERRGIVFLGSFRHPPNLEAARYLCREILPRLAPDLLEEHPLYLVGTDLGDEVREAARGLANVRLVGWAPSVAPYLERARISVAPLLHGAGTKTKLIKALMIGTPSVSTTIGAEGLHLEDGRHVLIADDPATFAEAVARLLYDRALWNDLASAGRSLIAAAHGRRQAQARQAEVVAAILATGRDDASAPGARAAGLLAAGGPSGGSG